MHTNKNTVLPNQHICSFTVFPIQRDNSVYETRALTKTNILTSEMQAQTNCTTRRAALSNDDAQTAQHEKGAGRSTQVPTYVGTGNNYQTFPFCSYFTFLDFAPKHFDVYYFIVFISCKMN